MPSAHPADWISAGRSSYSTHGIQSTLAGRVARSDSSWPLPMTRNADLGGQLGCGEDRLQPVERYQLADEESMKRPLGLPTRMEQPVLGARRNTPRHDRAQPELLEEESRVGVRVGDDDIGSPKCPSVDEVHDSCARSTLAETCRDRSTTVSWRETSGLKITGRPRATRFAAGRSK